HLPANLALHDALPISNDPGFQELRQVRNGQISAADLPENLVQNLVAGGWLMESGADPGTRYRLKYVSFEASTVCNQACYFCPVRSEEHTSELQSLAYL